MRVRAVRDCHRHHRPRPPHSLTPGGASQHLAALRAAGLVSAHRSGRKVLYVRTRAAETLLAAAESN